MPEGDKNSHFGLFERNSSSRAFCLFDLNPARLKNTSGCSFCLLFRKSSRAASPPSQLSSARARPPSPSPSQLSSARARPPQTLRNTVSHFHHYFFGRGRKQTRGYTDVTGRAESIIRVEIQIIYNNKNILLFSE
jgi:hypothetical protein